MTDENDNIYCILWYSLCDILTYLWGRDTLALSPTSHPLLQMEQLRLSDCFFFSSKANDSAWVRVFWILPLPHLYSRLSSLLKIPTLWFTLLFADLRLLCAALGCLTHGFRVCGCWKALLSASVSTKVRLVRNWGESKSWLWGATVCVLAGG